MLSGQQASEPSRSHFNGILIAIVRGAVSAVVSGVVGAFLASALYDKIAHPEVGIASAMVGMFAGGFVGIVVGIFVAAKALAKRHSSLDGRNPVRATGGNFGSAVGVVTAAMALWVLTIMLLHLMSVNMHGTIGTVALLVLSFFVADWFVRVWRIRTDVKVLIAIVLYGIYTVIFFTR